MLHLASAAPNVNWGLSCTQQYITTDVVHTPIQIVDGHVLRPNGPGLGVEIDETALRKFMLAVTGRPDAAGRRDRPAFFG